VGRGNYRVVSSKNQPLIPAFSPYEREKENRSLVHEQSNRVRCSMFTQVARNPKKSSEHPAPTIHQSSNLPSIACKGGSTNPLIH
jgi:hypothetical protein